MTSKIYSPKEIADIILCCIKGMATEEQLQQLENWLSESDANRKFYDRLMDEHYRMEKLQEFVCFDSHQDWQKVQTCLVRSRKNIFYRFLPYAAILVFAFSVWGIFHFKQSVDNTHQLAQNAIKPGSAKACLILPDGSSIDLDSKPDTLRVKNANFINNGRTLAYLDSVVAIPEKHILRVPRGGEYNLVLADGTKVWLNAETELHYPDHFTGGSREVQLTGEAYFEVTKDVIRPFYVKTAGMVVKVLGTSFNVRAYPEEIQQATLVNGKVEVACAGRYMQINPGEQLTMANGQPEVREVNVNNYVGWKEQRFVFDDKMLIEVLSDLERWYDVSVFIADNAVRELRFTANLPKYENMDKVLQIIELAACVKCEVKGRTVVVRTDR